jgi:hypothetical protein
MRRLPGTRPNVPTDRKLGPGRVRLLCTPPAPAGGLGGHCPGTGERFHHEPQLLGHDPPRQVGVDRALTLHDAAGGATRPDTVAGARREGAATGRTAAEARAYAPTIPSAASTSR